MPINNALATEQWLRFQYCRDNGHLDFVAKAEKCDNFFIGNQWAQADTQALAEAGRPALTINKIISTIGTILGEQIYNRTEVLFRPSAGSPAEVAEALSKVWMQISQNNQLPWIRSDVFCDGIVRGRGFYDVRLNFDDAMLGEVRINMLNSKNVVIDPDAEEYDPSTWNDLFITKWMTHQDIAVLYNEEDAEALKDKESSLYGYDSIEMSRDRFGTDILLGAYGPADEAGVRKNIRVVERQYRKLDKQEHFVDVTTGDMRPVPVDWDRNKIAQLLERAGGQLATTTKLVKRIRNTVTADEYVLHDEWWPHQHMSVVPYFPYFRYGKTVGIVENLLGPQEILNKVSSQELHVVNTTANSGWAVEEGSLMNMSIEELELMGAKTGLVLEYRKGAQPPEKITPNQTPNGLDRISYKAEEHIKAISNVSDSMQGFDREDVAAKAIAYKQQRGSVNMTKVLDNLERSDWILARNVLDLVQNYYTEERILNITKDDFTQEQQEVTINEFDPVTGTIANDLTIGEYDIVITSSPYRASLEDSQFEQAKALREIGVEIDDTVLIENSRLLRRADIVKQLQDAKNSPEAQARAELEQRMAEAEVAYKEAQAQKLAVDTQKAGADTQIKMNEAQAGPGADTQLEMMRLEMERERMQMELEFKRQEMALKQQEMEMKMQLQARQAQQDAMIKQQQAEQDAATQRVKAMQQMQQAASSATNEE